MALTKPCAGCGGTIRVEISELVFSGRIEWSVHDRCDNCGFEVYECGDGVMPEPQRSMLIEQSGLSRVRADAGSRPLRVRLMKVFRDGGAGLAEASDAVERLTHDGVTGTRAEMELLAERLRAAGATVEAG
jgi:hypothetical protein